MKAALSDRVDHLVYATPDVEKTVVDLERRLGVRAAEGGRHLGRGTRNALLSLGPRSYLEIIGPDHSQPKPPGARWYHVDDIGRPGLVAWAARVPDMEASVAGCAARGVQFGPITPGHRQRPDGFTLRWRFTEPTTEIEGGVVPFLIDWAASPHPAASLTGSVTLSDFRAEHPRPENAGAILRELGLELEVELAPVPALVAVLQTRNGLVELR